MTRRLIAAGLVVLVAAGVAPAGPPVKPPPLPTPPPAPKRPASTGKEGRWQTQATVTPGSGPEAVAYAVGWVGVGAGGNLVGWWARRRGGRAWVAGLSGAGLGAAVGTGLGLGCGPLAAPPGPVFSIGLGVVGLFTLTGGLVAWAAARRRPPDEPADPPSATGAA